ncbi:hypothetical protein Tco_0987302 [Tanacetum coccineum]
MLNNQKLSSCKIGLGFDSSKASTSETKSINFVGSSAEIAPDGYTIKAHRSTIPRSVDPSSGKNEAEHVCLRTCLEPDEWIIDGGCSKHMTGNKSLFSTYKAYDVDSRLQRIRLVRDKAVDASFGLTPESIGKNQRAGYKQNSKAMAEVHTLLGNQISLLLEQQHTEQPDSK